MTFLTASPLSHLNASPLSRPLLCVRRSILFVIVTLWCAYGGCPLLRQREASDMKRIPSSEPASPSSAIKRSSSAPLLGGNPNKATLDEEAALADKAALVTESAPTPAKSWYEWLRGVNGSEPAPSRAPVIGVPVAEAQAPIGGDTQGFKLNERVECRDDGKKWWAGTVVSVEPLLVQPTGAAWTKGFTWDEVRIPMQGGAPTSPSLTSSTAAKDAPAVAEKVVEEEGGSWVLAEDL